MTAPNRAVPRPEARSHRGADLALIGVTFIWGSTFVIVKDALSDISPLLFLVLRFSLASVALALILGPGIRATRSAAKGSIAYSLKGGLLAGVFLWSGYALQTFGLMDTSPSKAGFLTGLAIPMVPLFAALIYRKPPRSIELTGIAVAASGMALMTLQSGALEISRGDLLVILSAVTWALHIVTLGHFAVRGNTAILSISQIAFAAILSASTFWWVETVRVSWTPAVWVALVVTSIFATALAFSVQTWAQQFSTPTRTALIFALEGIFAWLTSFVLTGELLSRRATFGAALIVSGILLVEVKKAPSTAN